MQLLSYPDHISQAMLLLATVIYTLTILGKLISFLTQIELISQTLRHLAIYMLAWVPLNTRKKDKVSGKETNVLVSEVRAEGSHWLKTTVRKQELTGYNHRPQNRVSNTLPTWQQRMWIYIHSPAVILLRCLWTGKVCLIKRPVMAVMTVLAVLITPHDSKWTLLKRHL